MNQLITTDHNLLIKDVRLLIDQAKARVARVANFEMTMVYWHIGKRIQEEILQEERAEYGQQVIRTVAQHLSVEYGRGFTRTGLIRMIQFYNCFKDYQIGATLSHQLSWSHIIELLPIENVNQRDFYAYLAMQDNLSVRQLRSNIHKMTYERSEFSKKSEEHSGQILSLLKSNNELTPELVLRDPYLLEFLNLPEEHYESDLENAILQQIELFLLELGTGVRHEVVSKSCFRESRKPSMSLDEPRDMNKELSRQCDEMLVVALGVNRERASCLVTMTG